MDMDVLTGAKSEVPIFLPINGELKWKHGHPVEPIEVECLIETQGNDDTAFPWPCETCHVCPYALERPSQR